MDDQAAFQLEEKDIGLLQALLNGALLRTSYESVHVQRAVEALITMLSGGTQVEFQSDALFQAQQNDDLMLRESTSEKPSSLMELGVQVSKAAERVSTLRRRAAQIIMPTLSAHLEDLRPAQQSGEVTFLTPGRPARSPIMEADAASCNISSNDKLLKGLDKLPALRARLDEVTRRLANVMRAIEEQKMSGKTQSTPIRTYTPSNYDADWLIGTIARVTRQ
ncbi:hypothetical protein Vafri_1138 [Volvox africanus]|nr:hypothetical protein Vafri_1138 [Volvox africanus]